jgi:hypothetical protein
MYCEEVKLESQNTHNSTEDHIMMMTRTARGRVVLKTLIAVQLVKKFLQFMETDISLRRMNETAINTF